MRLYAMYLQYGTDPERYFELRYCNAYCGSSLWRAHARLDLPCPHGSDWLHSPDTVLPPRAAVVVTEVVAARGKKEIKSGIKNLQTRCALITSGHVSQET